MGDKNVMHIEMYVQRQWLPKLAPTLGGLLARLEKAGGHREGGPFPVRVALRKALAFDGPVRSRAHNACGFLVMTALVPIVGLCSEPSLRIVPGILVMTLMALAGALSMLVAVAARTRELNRLLSTGVAVPAQVTSAAPYRQPKAIDQNWVMLILDYSHDGTRCQTSLHLTKEAASFVEGSVDIVLDPSNPQACLVRDLYL